jgi:hypothetical protein
MIKSFQEREASERIEASKNRFIAGSNIDIFKHSQKLADITSAKTHKKKTLLEEILSKQSSSGNPGKPIIIVPGSYYPGNICLKNAVSFLGQG